MGTVSKSSTFTECNEGNKTSAFPSKRPRLDDSKLAKETIEDILKCKPVGVEVMQHYKDTETFQYRQEIVKDPKKSTSIFHIFPQFRDTKGLIHQDLALMFGLETTSSFLEKWNTSFKKNVIKKAKTLNPSAFLLQLLKSAEKNNGENSNEEWDSDITSLLLLLHLLAPQPSGRKRAAKISVRDAVCRLLKFEKKFGGPSLRGGGQTALSSGHWTNDVLKFYIVVDKNLIPCQASTSLGAFDELFKAHFVFGAQYDPSLSNMFTFIQTTVYKIYPSTSSQSSCTRNSDIVDEMPVFSKILNILMFREQVFL